MACTETRQPAAVEGPRVPLEVLDTATLRALCDGG